MRKSKGKWKKVSSHRKLTRARDSALRVKNKGYDWKIKNEGKKKVVYKK